MVNEGWLKTIEDLRMRGARRVRITADSLEVDFGDSLVAAVAALTPDADEAPAPDETPAEAKARYEATLFRSCG